jgi:hypothetical protein
MSKKPWSKLALVEGFDCSCEERVFFSALAEAAASKIKARYEEEVDAGSLENDPTEIRRWASEKAIEEVEGIVNALDAQSLLDALEGEIADRELEVLGESGQLSEDLKLDLELALRNEAMFRLTQRGAIPEGAWREERYSADG